MHVIENEENLCLVYSKPREKEKVKEKLMILHFKKKNVDKLMKRRGVLNIVIQNLFFTELQIGKSVFLKSSGRGILCRVLSRVRGFSIVFIKCLGGWDRLL